MIHHLLSRRIPGQLVIQLTDRCNALCPQCGMRRTEDFSRSTLGIDDVKRIIDAAALRGVKSLSFTGGEPFLYLDQIIELTNHAAAAGIPFVRTGTNGFLFMNWDKPDFERRISGIAERLARTKLYTFWISLDSAIPKVHEAMRGLPGVVKGIERALPIFRDHGIYPSANLGINRNIGGWFDSSITAPDLLYAYFWKSFRDFYRVADIMGFTIANACYPMSLNTSPHAATGTSVYRATSADAVVSFSPEEKKAVFTALFDVIPEFRSRIRIFTPRSSLLTLIRQQDGKGCEPYACRGGKEFFFIEAGTGDTFPCGYRGTENLGKFWDPDFPARNGNAPCTKCDWECFRDPSELMGPFQDLVTRPGRLVSKIVKDQEWLGLWLEDLRYYRGCNFFNGRVPADAAKLGKFFTEKYNEHRSWLCL